MTYRYRIRMHCEYSCFSSSSSSSSSVIIVCLIIVFVVRIIKDVTPRLSILVRMIRLLWTISGSGRRCCERTSILAIITIKRLDHG